MRLWHQDIIPRLPRQQLLGQHRECCALRGNGWNKPHSTVNYIFKYSPYLLFRFHNLVMKEMINRGYKIEEKWLNPRYRGKNSELWHENVLYRNETKNEKIYKEHNNIYLKECLDNLKEKGINI